MGELRVVSGGEVRATIAELLVPLSAEHPLGQIQLKAHQSDAVRRLKAAIARYGGALLCDPVGTGKTFSALGVASGYSHVTLVAPASLRGMWLTAAGKAEVRLTFISHEGLSRAAAIEPAPGLVVVDEAHHARNRATNRFRALSSLVHGADVLLLTATPVHNRPRDLEALQSLYLGERASMLGAGEIAETVVRRDTVLATMPRVAPVEWMSSQDDRLIPEMILALPPPLPVREGGAAETLIRLSLVRQWGSTDAALRAALSRRRSRAGALIAALHAGRYPSRSELAAWAIGDDAVQLAFPELMTTEAGPVAELLPVVEAHAAALERMLAAIGTRTSRDRETAQQIQAITSRHPEIPVVAFSAYEESVNALFRFLAPSGEVAALSGHGGKVSGGSISRREVIERFAPRASGRKPPSAANRVSLLIATDLMSEGVNLQDAGVVVHVDLPFTHARLEQRVGRAARIGSPHDVVHSYAFRPPASAETLTRIESLLGIKLSFELDARSIPDEASEVERRIVRWRGFSSGPGVVGAVRAPLNGLLVVARVDGHNQLLAAIGDVVTDDPALIAKAIRVAHGVDMPISADMLARSVSMVSAHLDLVASLDASPTPKLRRRIHRRISRIVKQARPHQRGNLIELAELARSAASITGGARLDAEFAGLASAGVDDTEWLASFAGVQGHRPDQRITEYEILAMLLLVDDGR